MIKREYDIFNFQIISDELFKIKIFVLYLELHDIKSLQILSFAQRV